MAKLGDPNPRVDFFVEIPELGKFKATHQCLPRRGDAIEVPFAVGEPGVYTVQYVRFNADGTIIVKVL